MMRQLNTPNIKCMPFEHLAQIHTLETTQLFAKKLRTRMNDIPNPESALKGRPMFLHEQT